MYHEKHKLVQALWKKTYDTAKWATSNLVFFLFWQKSSSTSKSEYSNYTQAKSGRPKRWVDVN